LLALLSVFAIELSNTQAKSRRDVEARVHERAVLAAALVDSLFQTIRQQTPQYERLYGGRGVSGRTLDAYRQSNAYLALLDPEGRVLASSEGFTSQARAGLAGSAAVALVRAGRPYGLGNVVRYGRTSAIDFAVEFPTRYGPRILLSGASPLAIGSFLAGELRQIPGVSGAHNYVIDGNDTVLASTNPATPAGYRFSAPAQVQALSRSSGDRKGHYYDEVRVADSTWRIVLAAPDGPLFASVSGLRKWLPWLIFGALGGVAAVALALGVRVVRMAKSDVSRANARLVAVNHELELSNTALEQRAAELARSNSELEAFSYSVSHDLRAPLRAIDGFSRMVISRYGPVLDADGRGMLERVRLASQRMSTLIEELLTLSRLSRQRMRPEQVDLSGVAREIVAQLEGANPGRSVAVTVAEGMLARGDRELLRVMLQNLLENAWKFTSAAADARIEFVRVSNGADGEFAVRDNGVGFDMEFSEKLFRPFERLHSRADFEGSGVGLATVQRIVHRHGGTVRAEAKPDHGACFYFTLPNGSGS
jgi:signal transduction histidine kinase